MIPIKKALTSSLGKKYLMAISGVGLLGFIVVHLLGNLTLYYPDSYAFNAYAKGLHDFGPLLYVAEVGLAAVFGLHIVMALVLQNDKTKARYQKYKVRQESKGGGSRMNTASRNMIITGVVLGAFLIYHIAHFRLGLFGGADYTTMVDGEEARDLYRLVDESFSWEQWWNVVLYMGVMGFLMLHLRHAFWSWFQSLGMMKPEWSDAIYKAGFAFAVAIAAGFLFIPLWFLFDVPGLLQ